MSELRQPDDRAGGCRRQTSIILFVLFIRATASCLRDNELRAGSTKFLIVLCLGTAGVVGAAILGQQQDVLLRGIGAGAGCVVFFVPFILFVWCYRLVQDAQETVAGLSETGRIDIAPDAGRAGQR
jgi:hypothetical protein